MNSRAVEYMYICFPVWIVYLRLFLYVFFCKFVMVEKDFYWLFAFVPIFIYFPSFAYYFSSQMKLLWNISYKPSTLNNHIP